MCLVQISSRTHTPAAQDPLLHLSFDAPAAKKAAPRTPVVDPGLDLHMDSSR